MLNDRKALATSRGQFLSPAFVRLGRHTEILHSPLNEEDSAIETEQAVGGMASKAAVAFLEPVAP